MQKKILAAILWIFALSWAYVFALTVIGDGETCSDALWCICPWLPPLLSGDVCHIGGGGDGIVWVSPINGWICADIDGCDCDYDNVATPITNWALCASDGIMPLVTSWTICNDRDGCDCTSWQIQYINSGDLCIWPVPTPIDGACGSAHGQSFSSTPSTNLCTTWISSSVITAWNMFLRTCGGLYSWNTAACNATYTPIPNNGWGGGWGGFYYATCKLTDLMCVSNTYQKKPWVFCQWGEFLNACGTWIILTGNIVSGSIVWSPYTNEINQAYLWAYQRGITTMPTIQQANIRWTLIRRDLAKMMSNFAIRILDMKPNTWLQCNFTDMATQTFEMKYYAKLACQLGIMGLKSNGTPDAVFSPNAMVTRAMFGTTLSRVVRWDRYNWDTPFYKFHLQALQKSGIMLDISAPSNKEVRWYVMIMLQRAYTKIK